MKVWKLTLACSAAGGPLLALLLYTVSVATEARVNAQLNAAILTMLATVTLAGFGLLYTALVYRKVNLTMAGLRLEAAMRPYKAPGPQPQPYRQQPNPRERFLRPVPPRDHPIWAANTSVYGHAALTNDAIPSVADQIDMIDPPTGEISA